MPIPRTTINGGLALLKFNKSASDIQEEGDEAKLTTGQR